MPGSRNSSNDNSLQTVTPGDATKQNVTTAHCDNMTSADTPSPGRKSLTCPTCSGVFEELLVLTNCYHAFCFTCMQKVADDHSEFPCPACRTVNFLPPAPSPQHQTKKNGLEKTPKSPFHCKIHADEIVGTYCLSCEIPLCLKCVMTRHTRHDTQGLAEAARKARSQLQEDQVRLEKALVEMDSKLDTSERELRELEAKKAAVEKDFRDRHAMLVAAAKSNLNRALQSLHDITAAAQRKVTEDLSKERQQRDELLQLQRRLQESLSTRLASELVDVAKEMKRGRGSERSLQSLQLKKRTTITHPVVRYTTTAEAAVKHISDYIGTPASMILEVKEDERWLTTVERFNIAEEPGTEVFSICITKDGNVKLSYAWRNFSQNTCVEDFDSNGSFLSKNSKLKGKFSFKSGRHGEVLDQIKCGPHRAFDCNSTGDMFALIEEPPAPHVYRTLRLFTKRQEDMHSPTMTIGNRKKLTALIEEEVTYTPPVMPFQPSDVCFYKKDGLEVLLIADEVNDTIHVVRMESTSPKAQFVRYLCPGHSLLIQPTALAVDKSNRVWVACRGRNILIIKPRYNIPQQEKCCIL